KSSGRTGEVRKRSIYIPPRGYVAGVGELIVLFACILVMAGLGSMMWASLVEIPSVPKGLVFRSAYVTHALGVSKSTSQMYIKVARQGGEYDHSFDIPNREARLLGIHKFKRLWVAIDADRDNQFVWAVYDERFQLMMSRRQIVGWAEQGNDVALLMVFCSCLIVVYGVFNMGVCGVWNRYYYKKDSE
ncbi:hypothetical protein, partial [Pseudomonas psychrophila]|uniref:hypothetical protein n=1 Tax=Pseudomonas psychrophila TaxID=122355 RepID=UPI000653AF62